jgi:hypothetical protein
VGSASRDGAHGRFSEICIQGIEHYLFEPSFGQKSHFYSQSARQARIASGLAGWELENK